MALKFSKERSFWWPVTVYVPEDNGEHKPYEFNVKIKDHQATEYYKALLVNGEKLLSYLCDLIVSWEGVQGEDGKEIPCTDENKRLVFDTHYIFSGLIDALKKAHKDAPAKN